METRSQCIVKWTNRITKQCILYDPMLLNLVVFSCEFMSNSFAVPWTVACQAPLSMGFPRQKYWSGCHFLLQGIFLAQRLNLCLLHSRRILYHRATGEALIKHIYRLKGLEDIHKISLWLSNQWDYDISLFCLPIFSRLSTRNTGCLCDEKTGSY